MALTRLKNVFTSKTGRCIYVNPDDFDASDSFDNRGNSPNRPFTVGFAAETENVLTNARNKLLRKNLDMIIANKVGDPSEGFNSDDNRTTILWKDNQQELPIMSKAAVSSKIIALIAETVLREEDG